MMEEYLGGTKWRRPLVRLLELLVIGAMGTLVLDVLLGVGTRQLGTLKYWLDSEWGVAAVFLPEGQIGWTEELARILMVWTAVLGAALAFERRAHLGVDYLVGKFHPGTRKLVQTIGHLVVMAFAVLVLIKGGATVVERTMESGQLTPALGLRKWMVYSVVPLSGVFVILFALQNLVSDLRRTDRGEVPE